jgi:hypothetical protein
VAPRGGDGDVKFTGARTGTPVRSNSDREDAGRRFQKHYFRKTVKKSETENIRN